MFSKIIDVFDFIFKGPAVNQLRISKTDPKKFGSYTQLKKYQRHFRKVAFQIFSAALFLLIGILFGPIIFQNQFQSEIYIPDGKGDILIANISKNQATVIFKTLDQKHNDKPLATSAMVEVYLDKDLKVLYKRTDVFEYAVTHIIPLNGLQEGRSYYLKVMASESSDMSEDKEVASWGGKEPISFYTTGEVVSGCEISQAVDKAIAEKNSSEIKSQQIDQNVQIAPSMNENTSDNQILESDSLKIGIVQSENHLYNRDRIQTIVSWETNIDSDSTLVYRSEKDANEIEFKKEGEFVKKHAIVMTTLKPETVYYFKAKSKTKDGQVTFSNEYSMKTPKKKQTVMQMVGDNLVSLMKQVKI